ncbi:MAG: DUF4349 domain-containing protein [Vicinamibacterales bacterium]
MDASRISSSVRRVTFFLIGAVVVGLFLTVACGGSNDDDGDDADSMPIGEMAMATTATGAAAPTAFAESTSGFAAQPTTASDAPASFPDLAAAQPSEQHVIRTATITLSVVDGEGGVGGAMASVRLLAAGKGGFVFASNSYIEQDRQFAQITIRVPVDQFDTTMNDLRSSTFVDEVLREESTSQDVSAEFVDNESRLKALRETELRFLDLLGDADTVDEVLRMEYELSNIRSQIETIQGRQNYLEQATAFSTITVALQPSGAPAEPQRADGDFFLTRIVESAWNHSRGAIEDILVATLTIAIVAGALLPLALVSWIAYRVYRSWTRRQEVERSTP